jgi:hypothetical protein
MKKILWRVASVFGFVAVILAAMASNTGEDLIYTIPIAVVGCLVFLTGAVQMRHIKAQKITIHTASTAYRLGFRRNKHSWSEEAK